MNRITRSRKLVSLVLAGALVIALGSRLRPDRRVETKRPVVAAAVKVPVKRGLLGIVERARIDHRRPLAMRTVEERAQAWLEAHPPRPEVRAALLGIAARAELVRRPLPRVAESDAEAAAVAAAHRERAAQQAQFRLDLRAALRAMTPAERAAMRASNVHIIQLARQMAQSANS